MEGGLWYDDMPWPWAEFIYPLVLKRLTEAGLAHDDALSRRIVVELVPLVQTDRYAEAETVIRTRIDEVRMMRAAYYGGA